jgi:ABC-2 type transport system permease protein
MLAVTKYTSVLRITAMGSLVYRGDALIHCVWMGLILFVFVQLWTVTYERGGFRSVAGFSLADMVWYLVITETVVLSAPRVSMKIDEEVKSGELAYVLLRPYSYGAYHLSAYWGEAAIRLPINAALGSAVALAAVGPPPAFSAAAAAATALAIVASLTLNFLVELAIGLLAFWFEDTLPFFWIYQKLVFTIGGLFLPLELLPGPLAAVSALLPFAAVTYAPARIFAAFSPGVFATQLALQLVWIGVLAGMAAAVYSLAVRKVNIHGG